jgi:carboxylesterase type B
VTAGARARVAEGVLRGVAEGGVMVFRGVPYAAPARRLTPPEPAVSWRGERDASVFGPPAAQGPGRMAWVPGLGLDPVDSREDCLTLNIWTPACDDGRRPVLLFLHGGAFVFGSGAQPMYAGLPLARDHGLVVVTANYRLGFLGFGHDEEIPANLGLRDQLAALRWIREKIAAFGGDPGRITLAGHSAGGTSTLALLSMPEVQGLVARAAILSAVPHGFTTVPEALRFTGAVRRALGGADPRIAPLPDVLAAERAATAGGPPAAALLPVAPVVDGRVLSRRPMDAVRAGAFARVPLLVSTTAEEMRLFAAIDPALAPEAPARTREVFEEPADQLARAHRGPVERVRFRRRSPLAHRGIELGAAHLTDVPFLLGTYADPRVAPLTGSGPAVEEFGRAVTAAFAGFCRGEPGAGFPAGPDIEGEEWHAAK